MRRGAPDGDRSDGPDVPPVSTRAAAANTRLDAPAEVSQAVLVDTAGRINRDASCWIKTQASAKLNTAKPLCY